MAIFSESSFCELQACTVQADTMVRLKCPLDKCPLSLLHVFSIQSLHLRHRTLVVHLVWKWVFLFATGAQVNCRSIELCVQDEKYTDLSHSPIFASLYMRAPVSLFDTRINCRCAVALVHTPILSLVHIHTPHKVSEWGPSEGGKVFFADF